MTMDFQASAKEIMLHPHLRNEPQKLTTITSAFGNINRSYLNEFGLYATYYGVVPNLIVEDDIDCKKASSWFREHYGGEIKDHRFSKVYIRRERRVDFDDLFYFLYDDVLINFDNTNCQLRVLFCTTDLDAIEQIVKELKKFKKKRNTHRPELFIIVNGGDGLDIKKFNIRDTRINLQENYNDDLIPIHLNILKRLNQKNDKGLVLLHGKPGTGKTNYIRHLIKTVKKDVLFMPPNLAGSLTSPHLLHLLMHNPNSVLVIEDAENIIIDRERTDQSSVSALLNLADGLLSDCLNIQVICSFNTDISRIDPALIRKGRIIARYEFTELETKKAANLSQKLGFNNNISAPMTLTSIYNQDEQDFQQSKKYVPIGFNSFTTTS